MRHLSNFKYFMKPPQLSSPNPGEDLYLYLSVTPATVSLVSIQEQDRIQRLMSYISHVLQDAKIWYLSFEKLT